MKNRKTFRDWFTIDTLPKKTRKNENSIINLDISTGGHWVCYYNYPKYDFVEYFDPFGGSTAVEGIMKPNLVHHINGLVNFTNDYASSEATNMFFYKDTSDAADRNFLKFEGTHADAEKMTTLIKKIKLN
ncbi:hypothetical protein TNCT_606921 [Trichonephila clavata]|uniref:Uncharacterized protein n=1 Tax=Trichonephila clavata TaxID=2740835 RepID=A0A8X6F864_TRICU|nr:hypothetical protein TNCT_606921 [Trichonephila clavata]